MLWHSYWFYLKPSLRREIFLPIHLCKLTVEPGGLRTSRAVLWSQGWLRLCQLGLGVRTNQSNRPDWSFVLTDVFAGLIHPGCLMTYFSLVLPPIMLWWIVWRFWGSLGQLCEYLIDWDNGSVDWTLSRQLTDVYVLVNISTCWSPPQAFFIYFVDNWYEMGKSEMVTNWSKWPTVLEFISSYFGHIDNHGHILSLLYKFWTRLMRLRQTEWAIQFASNYLSTQINRIRQIDFSP